MTNASEKDICLACRRPNAKSWIDSGCQVHLIQDGTLADQGMHAARVCAQTEVAYRRNLNDKIKKLLALFEAP
jgi:hypothetical protein